MEISYTVRLVDSAQKMWMNLSYVSNRQPSFTYRI